MINTFRGGTASFIRTRFGYFVPLILVMFIAGCINYEQTTTLNFDGSGTAEIHYWAEEDVVSFLSDGPLGFDEEKVQSQYEGDGITVLSVATEMLEEDSTRHVRVSLEFESIEELAKTKALKDVDISWVETDGLMKFTQEMKTGDNGGSMGMDQYTISYTYTMPGEIVSSNASDHDGQKLTWEHKLSDLSTGVTLSATVKKASVMSDILVPALIIIAVLIVLVIIIMVIRKGSNKNALNSPVVVQEIEDAELNTTDDSDVTADEGTDD
jgi:hypothetical protein